MELGLAFIGGGDELVVGCEVGLSLIGYGPTKLVRSINCFLVEVVFFLVFGLAFRFFS